MKILLGGIPLGCDNVGDEAIVACVVRMLRESVPGVELTVATADESTASLLGVAVVPPYGFAGVPLEGFADAARRHDAYVWCGATGLSDYPDVALGLLEAAQSAGVATYIWGVGMDDELNPVFFKAHGKRRLALSLLGLTGWYERRMRARLAKRIAAVLPKCRGVWLRDPQSAAMLAAMGYKPAGVAADTAILLGERKPPRAPGGAGRRPVLGLCISTQRQVADLDGVRRLVAAVRDTGARVTGIPMNPKTDRALLESLGVECIKGDTPEAVVEAAAECDVVLSSRLHLLILAANAGTPIMGIARGSKLANWLANFGRRVEGSVYDCDWAAVTRRVIDALSNRGDWDATRDEAYRRLRERFEKARREFAAALAGRAPEGWPRVSVLVRARNDEAFIGRTLDGIFSQSVPPFEVIVCDDASTDRTRETAARYPVRFFERPAGPYKPGRTLNALVREAKGDVVVFDNSDAVPLDPSWLRELVRPLLGARNVFAFANQLPRPDAQMLVRKDSERAFGDGRVQAGWKFFFSLASSATWRQNLVDVPFDEKVQYSEDVEWTWRNSRRAEDPIKVVYCPDSHVEHSHNYTVRQLWKRFRGEGAADRTIFGAAPSLVRELAGAARETLRDWAYLAARPRGWLEAPAAPVRRLVQHLAHWTGARR